MYSRHESIYIRHISRKYGRAFGIIWSADHP